MASAAGSLLGSTCLGTRVAAARVRALMAINEIADDNFQAAKYITEKGWDKRPAGRPTKDRTEREDNIMKKVNEDFADDFKRLKIV